MDSGLRAKDRVEKWESIKTRTVVIFSWDLLTALFYDNIILLPIVQQTFFFLHIYMHIYNPNSEKFGMMCKT